MTYRCLIPALVLALGPTACAVKNKDVAGSRDSGQSRLMNQTFAGQNACNPENHTRPFIIEWDATDMSSFEAHAANDVVIVKYEGCELRVLDECKNDSIRGEQGAYLPPEWTSGSLETIDIKTEGELVAKLPLGVATLGGRVAGGEQFHMEYFVAGTRNATRDSVYEGDLADNPGCEGATHFVYAYNLGAFALGSAAAIETDVNGSAYGFGASGHAGKSKSAEKKGGDLGVCRADDATEVQGCKAPIRLSLRQIRDGDNPNEVAKKAADTPESLNAAGQVAAELNLSKAAQAHYDAATRAAAARDGKGCLAQLDAFDKADPVHASTKLDSPLSFTRGQCLMLAGKCKAGKVKYRQAMEKNGQAEQFGAEHVDRVVEQYAAMYCEGELDDRTRVISAIQSLSNGAYVSKRDVKYCAEHFGTIKKLRGKVKPKNDDDSQIISLDRSMIGMAPECFARAGDCKKAFEVYKEVNDWINPDASKGLDKATADSVARTGFESMVRRCKDK